MTEIMLFSEVVEENGKTVRENNLQISHNIPLDTLVEVKYDEWHEHGACSKVHARLWVVIQGRDCDGTPIYWLSPTKRTSWDVPPTEANPIQKLIYGFVGGFGEKSLKPVEVTEALRRGEGVLSWEEK